MYRLYKGKEREDGWNSEEFQNLLEAHDNICDLVYEINGCQRSMDAYEMIRLLHENIEVMARAVEEL